MPEKAQIPPVVFTVLPVYAGGLEFLSVNFRFFVDIIRKIAYNVRVKKTCRLGRRIHENQS